MILDIIPFDAAHLDSMELTNLEVVKPTNLQYATGFTAVKDGVIIGAGGINRVWGKVGEAWMVPTIHFENNHKIVYKISKDYVDMMEICYTRLQALIRVDLDIAKGFVEHLGFKKEATLRRYGLNQEDYDLYARLI